jgi:hypothetical protein
MASLSCNATPISDFFDPASSSWTAHEAIAAIEKARAALVKPGA